MTTEDQRAALDAEGIAAMAAAGIPRASITAKPQLAVASSVLTATVRGYVVRLHAAEHICHRAEMPASALKYVLRRIPREAT
jgi:hypothetical protein